MSTVTLSDLVVAGLPGARLHLGGAGPRPAGALTEQGLARLRPGGPSAVGAILTNDAESVSLILSAIVGGTTLVSLPLPGRSPDLEAYTAVLGAAVAAYGVERVVARDDVAALLATAGIPTVAHGTLGRAGTLAAPAAGGFTLVQFSSGSTGPPKPVAVSDGALGANVDAIVTAIEPRPGDAAVSWLPLSHDMGLVGMFLTAVASTSPSRAGPSDVVLLDPEAFLRAPTSWLAALDRWRGTITAAPDVGFRLAVRRGVPTGLDLARVRCAIAGGEVVRAETLRAFAEALGPSGFRADAICPAYGMAEAGLAVTMTPWDEPWTACEVDVAALAEHRVSDPPPARPGLALVGAGRPLAGYDVEAPTDGTVGPIRVAGPSIRPDEGEARWRSTGDLGFRRDGTLFVVGRRDDHVVAHGRNLYAPALEAAVSEVAGVRPGRVTVVGLPDGRWIVAVEPADRGGGEPGRQALARAVRVAVVGVGGATPDEVVLVPPGRLPLTSSGKLQRNEVRRRYLLGTLAEPDVDG